MALLGMKIENAAWNFAMSSELEMLIAKFNRTVYDLYTPGAADTLDWVCFCLMATLLQQENMPESATFRFGSAPISPKRSKSTSWIR